VARFESTFATPIFARIGRDAREDAEQQPPKNPVPGVFPHDVLAPTLRRRPVIGIASRFFCDAFAKTLHVSSQKGKRSRYPRRVVLGSGLGIGGEKHSGRPGDGLQQMPRALAVSGGPPAPMRVGFGGAPLNQATSPNEVEITHLWLDLDRRRIGFCAPIEPRRTGALCRAPIARKWPAGILSRSANFREADNDFVAFGKNQQRRFPPSRCCGDRAGAQSGRPAPIRDRAGRV